MDDIGPRPATGSPGPSPSDAGSDAPDPESPGTAILPTTGDAADGRRATPHRQVARLKRVETAAERARTRWQRRFEATVFGKVWNRLSSLGFVDSSLQFSAAFILFFIPFLLLVSAAIGRDLPHALVTRSGFGSAASHDVTSLFAHSHTHLTAFTIVGVVLTVAGADSMTRTLQKWYEKVFEETVVGWKRSARRILWLAGAAGYLMMQFLIGRRFEPIGGEVTIAVSQFVLSVGFWWWSAHCLLAGQVRWRRLFPAGVATAVCYTGVGLYVRIWASWTIVSNENSYGPIGAMMTILATLVALGVAILLGAVIGADFDQLRRDPGPR
jgi:membrane protein